MDPLESAKPDEEGFLQLQRRSGRLHFQLYRPGPPTATATSTSTTSTTNASVRSPLLMVMGAFALKEHFATTARHIADVCGHEVCLYDHVGVGRSGPSRLEPQTAGGLAADALELADGLWGAGTAFHVYGCVAFNGRCVGSGFMVQGKRGAGCLRVLAWWLDDEKSVRRRSLHANSTIARHHDVPSASPPSSPCILPRLPF
jgi:hypothetical protein